MGGRRCLPVLRGDEGAERHAAILGYWQARDRCSRDDTWSYCERPASMPDERYHLRDDPRAQRILMDEHGEEAQRPVAVIGKVIQGKHETASGGVR